MHRLLIAVLAACLASTLLPAAQAVAGTRCGKKNVIFGYRVKCGKHSHRRGRGGAGGGSGNPHRCPGPPKPWCYYTPGPGGVTSADLWQEAAAELAIPSPVIVTAPPRGKRVLVHTPSWVWPARTQWTSRSATAATGGVSATVTARPARLTLDPGDGGDPVACAAPWDPYSSAKLDAGAAPDCALTWERSGRYTVTASLSWTAAWTGSDGDGGTLPDVTRTVRFPVRVVQARSDLVAGP